MSSEVRDIQFLDRNNYCVRISVKRVIEDTDGYPIEIPVDFFGFEAVVLEAAQSGIEFLLRKAFSGADIQRDDSLSDEGGFLSTEIELSNLTTVSYAVLHEVDPIYPLKYSDVVDTSMFPYEPLEDGEFDDPVALDDAGFQRRPR